MTYNIRYDNPNDGENAWPNRREFLAHQILFHHPDVLGIQEGLHRQVQYLNGTLKGYASVGVGREDGKDQGEYSAIFYDTEKLDVLQHSTFWLSPTPDRVSIGWDAALERICTYALFEEKGSLRKFWVFNTHLDHRGKQAREQSVLLILKTIEKLNQGQYPVILMGDFNAQSSEPPIQATLEALRDAKTISQFPPFGPEGTSNGFKFSEPVHKRIDYIFVSRNIGGVKRYAVLSDSKECRYPSDHLPVVAEILF
jgi:endonuclease/exonuclease/phosphatase family metal-dependent hydrolase